jgi:hypothetical protein
MRLTNQRNQCPTCDRYFGRTSGFSKHRVGKFGTGVNGSSPERRCMTDGELREAGFKLDDNGFWRLKDRVAPTHWCVRPIGA